jgi:hypothetical protein
MSYRRQTVCPHCTARHSPTSVVIGANRRQPLKDGNAALCLTCGHWAVCDSGAPGRLRLPTAAELHDLSAPLAQSILQAWIDFNRSRRAAWH